MEPADKLRFVFVIQKPLDHPVLLVEGQRPPRRPPAASGGQNCRRCVPVKVPPLIAFEIEADVLRKLQNATSQAIKSNFRRVQQLFYHCVALLTRQRDSDSTGRADGEIIGLLENSEPLHARQGLRRTFLRRIQGTLPDGLSP